MLMISQAPSFGVLFPSLRYASRCEIFLYFSSKCFNAYVRLFWTLKEKFSNGSPFLESHLSHCFWVSFNFSKNFHSRGWILYPGNSSFGGFPVDCWDEAICHGCCPLVIEADRPLGVGPVHRRESAAEWLQDVRGHTHQGTSHQHRDGPHRVVQGQRILRETGCRGSAWGRQLGRGSDRRQLLIQHCCSRVNVWSQCRNSIFEHHFPVI